MLPISAILALIVLIPAIMLISSILALMLALILALTPAIPPIIALILPLMPFPAILVSSMLMPSSMAKI